MFDHLGFRVQRLAAARRFYDAVAEGARAGGHRQHGDLVPARPQRRTSRYRSCGSAPTGRASGRPATACRASPIHIAFRRTRPGKRSTRSTRRRWTTAGRTMAAPGPRGPEEMNYYARFRARSGRQQYRGRLPRQLESVSLRSAVTSPSSGCRLSPPISPIANASASGFRARAPNPLLASPRVDNRSPRLADWPHRFCLLTASARPIRTAGGFEHVGAGGDTGGLARALGERRPVPLLLRQPRHPAARHQRDDDRDHHAGDGRRPLRRRAGRLVARRLRARRDLGRRRGRAGWSATCRCAPTWSSPPCSTPPAR